MSMTSIVNGSVLVVDSNAEYFQEIKSLLPTDTFVQHAATTVQAYSLLKNGDVGILVCNEHLPDENGLQFMGRINKEFPLLQPILMSEGIDTDLFEYAINDVGVLKYIKKPLNLKQTRKVIQCANENYRKAFELECLKENYQNIVAEVSSLPYTARRVRQTMRLILHDGKELAASVIFSIFVITGLFLGLGITALFALYIVKSLMGIDIFADSHLGDILTL